MIPASLSATVRPSARDLRLRAFRAVEDPETSDRFLRGHRRALAARGVRQVSSAKAGWTENPSVYAIVLECASTGRVLGGARVHLADGVHHLPVEEAVGPVDARIHDAVRDSMRFGAAELCGVWKTAADREGRLRGAVRSMALAQLALARGLGVRRGWGFAPEHTLAFWCSLGFRVDPSFGDGGAFAYPDDRFVSRVVVHDIGRLARVAGRDRRSIEDCLPRRGPRSIVRHGACAGLKVDLSVLDRSRQARAPLAIAESFRSRLRAAGKGARA